MPDVVTLLDLADIPVEELLRGGEGGTTAVLDAIKWRMFEPGDRDKLTVSAFGSAL